MTDKLQQLSCWSTTEEAVMRVMWCWRCQIDVPMLDEEEFARISALSSDCLRASKEFRQVHGLPLEGLGVAPRFAPVLAEYRRITGFEETNHNALFHHRISLYGPPCKSCGKPMRTRAALHCVACGAIDDEARA